MTVFLKGSLPALLAVLFGIVSLAQAEDWPQWLGPNRDSVWQETGLVEKFPEQGLTVKWRVPVSLGYSGPAVVGGKVYLTDYVKESGDTSNNPGQRRELTGKERVLCLNAADGKIVWEYSDTVAYKISYPSGPRCTPTVSGGKVYTLGAEGNLLCLDAGMGTVIWSKELKKEYKTDSPQWGFCGAPLVDGQKLICLVGGEGSVAVAFD